MTSTIEDLLIIMDTPILVLLLLIIYFSSLIVLKKLGYKEKIACEDSSNCCPNCNQPLERVRRKNNDRFFNFITFQIFAFKRYKCNHCEWEGLRWENKFDTNSAT